MENIVLIGMPGCGKSTVGVLLAKAAGRRFVDVDLVLQEMEDRLLQQILDEKGMEYFLQAEETAMLKVEESDSVVATGGSAVYSAAGMRRLKQTGVMIYLKLSLATLEKRLNNIKTRGIALGPGETLPLLYEKRSPLYERYADIIVEAEGLEAEEAVTQIILQLKGRNASCTNCG